MMVVLLPIGPATPTHFVIDTVCSVRHFMQPDTRIVAVDDTGAGVGDALQNVDPLIDVIPAQRSTHERNVYGQLYLNMSLGVRHALATYDFDVLLRLDTDALAIGYGADVQAASFFESNPEVGLLGAYRFDCDGSKREFGRTALRLRYEANVLHRWLAPESWDDRRFLRSIVRQATANGYRFGEHCLGAAMFCSRLLLQALVDANLLGRRELRDIKLGDDHLFGLLCAAAGFASADFERASSPLGLTWRGLPYSPAELLRQNKKIVHSTRFWNDMRETEIRQIFRHARESAGSSGFG